MDRYTQFGLRGDADEQIRRAVRDGFKRAGLSPAQLTQAMEWYRDHGEHLGGDEAKLAESFAEFTAKRAWPDAQRDAAVGVYGQVRDQGPAAVMAPPPSAEDDAATIARANELLRTDPAKYWADAELQEARMVKKLKLPEIRGVALFPRLLTVCRPRPYMRYVVTIER